MRLDVADRFLRGHLIAALFLWVYAHVHPLEDESHQVIDLLYSLVYRVLLNMLHGVVFFVVDLYFARIFSLGGAHTGLFFSFYLWLWFWGWGPSTKARSSRFICRWVLILKSLCYRLTVGRTVNPRCFLNSEVLFEKAIRSSSFNSGTNNLLVNQR